jgi:predicted RNase H-like HicB family nuclease
MLGTFAKRFAAVAAEVALEVAPLDHGATLTDVASEVTLTAIYEPVEDGWVQARVQELPEVITAGPSRKEAEDLLLDAILEYLTSLSEAHVSPSDVGEHQHLQLTVQS